MNTKRTKSPHAVKLSASHRQVVERYVASMRLAEGGLKFENDPFAAFREMVLSLPTCRDLGPWDVLSVAVDVVVRYGASRVPGDTDTRAGELEQQAINYVIGFLESLPRTYVVRYELPHIPYWGDFSIQLAENVTLTSRQPAAGRAKHNALVRALQGQSEEKDEGAVGLEFTLQGFASASPESPVVSESIALLKQVLFLLKHARVLTPVPWDERLAKASVLDKVDGRSTSLTLPAHLSKTLGAFRPDEEALKVWEPSARSLLSGVSKSPTTDAEWIKAVSDNAKLIPKFFANRHLTGFARVAAAIEWYEDSRLNDDQSMAFLAACIGLESIFGEESSGMNEMSQRLGDRYSFMLGKDRDERSRLASEFKQVLKVRGELVHARTSRLKAKDRLQLDKVRDMLWRSIQHEIRPFLADSPDRPT